MYARVTRVGPGGDLEKAIQMIRERIVPIAREQPGIVAAYWLVDRANSRGLAVTFWESEEAMQASAAVAREANRAEQRETGLGEMTPEQYEVVARL